MFAEIVNVTNISEFDSIQITQFKQETFYFPIESANDLKLSFWAPSKTYDKNLERESYKQTINSFLLLKHNWDGEGAVPLYDEVAKKSIDFISSLFDVYINKITDIYPNSNGTLSIEWSKDKTNKLSIEIGKSKFSLFFKMTNNEPEFLYEENIFKYAQDISKKLYILYS